MQVYREMVFEGRLPVVKAFLTGLRLGRRWSAEYLFCEEACIKGESQGHRLLERLHLSGNVTHVLVVERHAETVATAVRSARRETGLILRANRRVRAVSFDYEFKVYNRDVARRIRRALARRPEPIELVDAEEREEEHPGARGPEGYAPEHHYICQGRGRAVGPAGEMLTFRAALARMEWMHLTEMRLDVGR